MFPQQLPASGIEGLLVGPAVCTLQIERFIGRWREAWEGSIMTASKSRKARTAAPEPTARPRPLSEELPKSTFAEEGLSVDPDDMGARFLTNATEQRNFESLRPADTSEVWLGSAPLSDDPLTGPNVDIDESPWTNAVELTLQGGSGEPPTLDAAGPDRDDDDDDDDDQALDDEDGVNLIQPTIREGSLLDEEADEPGETRAPRIETDDTIPQGRRDRTL
jgi:hypothetical protein